MTLQYSVSIFLLFMGLFLVPSCGTASPASIDLTATTEPRENDVAPALEPLPSVPVIPTAEELPSDYPPVLPVQPTYPPNYPGPPTRMPTSDPYPGGMVWIIRPVGIQCEDGTLPGYGDLNESAATLTAAGMRIYSSEIVNLMVTTSCGSPTSAHYRVQISIEDLDQAVSMGWALEEI